MEFVCSDTAITFSIEKINTIVYELNAHVILGLLRLIKLTFSPYKTYVQILNFQASQAAS